MILPLNLPWEPDKGALSQSSLDYVLNVLPLPEGWGPISLLTEYTQALPSPCRGAWWFRSDAGVFNTIAATQTALYKLNTTAMSWTLIGSGYTGPPDGELWMAAMFGENFYLTNVNDALQVISTSAMTAFGAAPGSPPRAKFVATIGDFLFLAHLKVGGVIHPRSWQHSKINDATNWVVDGGPGSSDGQDIPDGDDIVAILPTISSGARIIQKRAKRGLVFSPGSATAFSQVDIDATRGAVAPHAVVALGSTSYFYLTENGFCMDDDYKSIGAEKVDQWFLSQIDKTRLYAVKASADPSKKIVWVTYTNLQGVNRIIGYNWFLDRWFQSDVNVDLFVTSVSPGYVLDDLTGVLDDYPAPPTDSAFWSGGILNFGAFKSDGKLYLFAGDKAQAIIDTPTMQLAEGRGAYVWGAELIGNLEGFTLQHATAFTPNQVLTWSSERTRSNITGICPFSKDGKWHRFRLNIGLGGSGTHVHGIRSHEKPSTLA